MPRRGLTTYDEAPPTTRQHKKPCHDCPWRRIALSGWLGRMTPEEWIQCVHSDAIMPCHAFKGPQCAGAAIFRANVSKVPRDGDALGLPADRKLVFAGDDEFIEHHS